MDVEGQFRKVTFQTGSFMVAWTWVLVYYAISHVQAGESPLEDQIGFGGHGQPQSVLTLALEYLLVCGLTAALLERVKGVEGLEVLAAALEFFPSPVFSGKLLQFLGQFHGGWKLGVLNIAVTAVVAVVVHAAPRDGQFKSFGDIVRNTVGFGLGVAWNVLVSQSEPAAGRIIARTIYLGVVLLLAARLAAPPPTTDSVWSRFASLLSFASRVVCAFAVVDWLQAVVPAGPLPSIGCLIGLVFLAAQMALILAHADLDRVSADANAKAAKQGWGTCILRTLVFVPCVWCCCPWVPLLWLLSSGGEGVKDRWTSLAADVCSLAASVVGTGLITGAVDSMAARWHICHGQVCNVGEFIVLEAVAAFVFTVTMVLCLRQIAEGRLLSEPADRDPEAAQPGAGYVVMPAPDPAVVHATVVVR